MSTTARPTFNGKQRKDKSMMKNYDMFVQSTLLWVENMLLCNEIRIKDVPRRLRIEMPTLYITAFRISRDISVHRYVGDMQVLYTDILCSESPEREELLKRMNNSLNWLECNSEEDFHAFQKDMDKEILQEVYYGRKNYTDAVRHELKERGF